MTGCRALAALTERVTDKRRVTSSVAKRRQMVGGAAVACAGCLGMWLGSQVRVMV